MGVMRAEELSWCVMFSKNLLGENLAYLVIIN
jgi:hypothetical protein